MRAFTTPVLVAAALILVLVWPAPAARAQSCASPIVLANQVPVSGNTCTGANPFPLLGATPSPHRDLVYRFTLQGQSNASLALSQANFPGAAVAFAQCVPSSEPIDALPFGPGPGATMVLSGLPAGDYFLVVTTHPDQPADICGQFGLRADGIWSDRIFAAGFQIH